MAVEYSIIDKDPSDPFFAMFETIRRDILKVAIVAHKTTLFREMKPEQQTQCFIHATMCALVGVAYSHVLPEGREMMLQYIKGAVDPASKTVLLEGNLP